MTKAGEGNQSTGVSNRTGIKTINHIDPVVNKAWYKTHSHHIRTLICTHIIRLTSFFVSLAIHSPVVHNMYHLL